MGERGKIVCPGCGNEELCCWPDIGHYHPCRVDLKFNVYFGDAVVEQWESTEGMATVILTGGIRWRD